MKTYSLNENYFKTYSHNMAYILGLWWADGSIYTKQKTFSITLLDDEELLNLILKEMESTHPLKLHKKTGAFNIKINNVNLYNSIIQLGGKPNKSLDPGYPNLPDEFFSSFLRGVFDGDGSIYIKKTAYISNISSGSRSFLEILESKITDINREIVPYISEPNGCYSLNFSQSDTIRLGYILYKHPSTLYMKRKYNVFKEMYQSDKNTYARLNDNMVDEILERIKNDKLKTYTQIIFEYNISKSSIDAILRRRLRTKVTRNYSDIELNQIKNKLIINNKKNHITNQGCNTRKLTADNVIEIRELYDSKLKTISELCKIYPLSNTAMRHVVNRRTWKHIS